VCLGSHRYLIGAIEGDSTYSLREFNSDYPEELLRKFIPQAFE
jgi:hypothetical protein